LAKGRRVTSAQARPGAFAAARIALRALGLEVGAQTTAEAKRLARRVAPERLLVEEIVPRHQSFDGDDEEAGASRVAQGFEAGAAGVDRGLRAGRRLVLRIEQVPHRRAVRRHVNRTCPYHRRDGMDQVHRRVEEDSEDFVVARVEFLRENLEPFVAWHQREHAGRRRGPFVRQVCRIGAHRL
jgi:hypothetical protein